MNDGRQNNGGARKGAGRPSIKRESLLLETLAKACPPADHEAIFAALSAKAKEGDIAAARLLLSYSCGTPPTSDDLAIQEKVNAIVLEFFQRLAPIYGDKKAREILGHLASDSPTTRAEPPRLPA
ncbi:hypothetical protein EON83_26290 [bacterium]|nr:MAG: hypothetical protein EON83_26290 [bacterium]